ncbi:MAG TPA: ribonuclease J [Polyangiales bacterium]|nr:ribonuclease J [Polyangiales bacterium]
MTRAVRLVALGGLGEVGMNCLVLEAEGRLVLIDCGVTFPDRQLGIDVIHPDFGYVLERAEALEAVVITHGHEDHIGALPYLLREIERDVPIYGPPYALALVREKLREADLGRPVRLIETQPRQPLALGPFEITPYRVTHSIPDSTGLLIRVAGMTLIHSGDFKIEDAPLDGQLFDFELLSEAGDRGVRLLLSDSTNSESPGSAGGEVTVSAALEARMARAEGRVIVCMFGSNVHRLGAVLSHAGAHGRKVLLLGRSLQTHARVAESLGKLPKLGPLLVNDQQAQRLPRSELLVCATGSQGEQAAALRRLAQATHPVLTLEPGDEVILSSRIIPGKEREVAAMVDALERRGVKVWSRRDDPALHVSGHACQAEQQKLIELTRPRAFIPVHGTFTHRKKHLALAQSLGVRDTLSVDNGQVVEIDADVMRIADEVVTGRVHIQHGDEIAEDVLHERAQMSEGGIVVVVLYLGHGSDVARMPEVIARGVTDELELEDLKLPEQAARAALRALRMLEPGASIESIQLAAQRAVRRVFRDALGWRPLVHTAVQRVT